MVSILENNLDLDDTAPATDYFSYLTFTRHCDILPILTYSEGCPKEIMIEYSF